MVAVAMAFGWWSLRPDGPEAVNLKGAVARVEPADSLVVESDEDTVSDFEGSVNAGVTASATISTERSDSRSATSVGTGAPDVTSSTEAPYVVPSTKVDGDAETPANTVADALVGVWTLVTAEGADALSAESAVSFGGYRVIEVLAGGVDESTVVGRTTRVSGSIELSGTALVAATVEVDIATVRTDDSHRDSHMRQALNTEVFPLAIFTLVEPVELPAGISDGERFSGSVKGDLTIKGVTNPAVFGLEAQLVGDAIVAVGSSEVVFVDHGVTAPTSAAVISVEDHGIIEVQLYFAR